DAFLQKRMFDPLGMKDTYFQLPPERIKDFTDNYAPFKGALLPIDPADNSIYLDKPAFAFGGAGMIGSAADYDKFLTMLRSEERRVGKECRYGRGPCAEQKDGE